MTDKVWMSGLFGNFEVGMKQGTRAKFFGHTWNPASFDIPVEPDEVFNAYRRYRMGYPLERSEFTEAIAVFDERKFSKIKEIFTAGPFYIVTKRVAEVFSRFNLGEGGLIPFPIYKADLETPYPVEFFLLNFGCRKNTLLPHLSSKVAKFVIEKKTGIQFWKINDWEEGLVSLSPDALLGPDLWVEEVLYNKIFMSDALGQALIDIGMKDVFALEECRIVEGPQ